MKKLIITLFLAQLSFAQVAIEKATVDGDGILDFASGTTKGIILPNVIDNSTMTPVTPGTIVFNRADAKVKYHDGTWKDLTTDQGTAPTLLPGVDLPNARVIIGDQNSTAEGVLVLEATDKALILPQVVDPVANVKSPVAGMICYDPVAKVMAVFNGKEWFFWR